MVREACPVLCRFHGYIIHNLNPAENCFGKLKAVLKADKFQSLMCANIKMAVAEVLKSISSKAVEKFFQFHGMFKRPINTENACGFFFSFY